MTLNKLVKSPSVVFPHESAFKALQKLESGRDPRVLVIDPYSRKLVGILCPGDFINLTKSNET